MAYLKFNQIYKMDSVLAVKEAAFKKVLSAKNSETVKQLESFFFGPKGEVTILLKKIKEINPEKRTEFGKQVNEIKTELINLIESKKLSLRKKEIEESIKNDLIDPTAPFDINSKEKPEYISRSGSYHPVKVDSEKMFRILESMGYIVEEHRLLDDDYHVFEALNIPKGHPARELWDTFWTDEGFIPTTHTSSMQIRVMQKYKHLLDKGEPIAVVIPGRCFRNEATDATHGHTFYQIEMVYIGKDISIGDMIGTMKAFLEKFFDKEDIKVQVQPSYFPFVEPGLQFMNECVFCNGIGCGICKYSGWIELMGCGYIHPKVLENAGIDSKKYTGFAFGPGIGRIVMLKNGIKDLRHFYKGDLRFLEQF
ncbi:phenylalanine--tRNA ligase subunit alpha [Candidatus Dojkabacteria bacterium]|nr:phenylalanine--tRNA ligase subunit alpha [Candidatus Dojkabacteria bacterium]